MSFQNSAKVSGPIGSLLTINFAKVWGQMAKGVGFKLLQESMNVLDVPVMFKR